MVNGLRPYGRTRMKRTVLRRGLLADCANRGRAPDRIRLFPMDGIARTAAAPSRIPESSQNGLSPYTHIPSTSGGRGTGWGRLHAAAEKAAICKAGTRVQARAPSACPHPNRNTSRSPPALSESWHPPQSTSRDRSAGSRSESIWICRNTEATSRWRIAKSISITLRRG